MKGKSKCKILKDIRKQIAKENDIEFVTSECKFQGDCTGTCPKCEAEVRYLEAELAKRKQAGKRLAVAGIAAAMMVSSSGCGTEVGQTAGDMMPESQTEISEPGTTAVSKAESSEWETMGIEVLPDDSSVEEPSDGEIAPPSDSSDEESDEESEVELMGDMMPE